MGNSRGTFASINGCGILVKKTERMTNQKINQPQIYFSLALVSNYSDDIYPIDCSGVGEKIVGVIDQLPIGSKVTFVGLGYIRSNDYNNKHYVNMKVNVKEIPSYIKGDGNTGIDLEHKCVTDKGNSNYQPKPKSQASDDDTPF